MSDSETGSTSTDSSVESINPLPQNVAPLTREHMKLEFDPQLASSTPPKGSGFKMLAAYAILPSAKSITLSPYGEDYLWTRKLL
ncbi:hypothetical protein TrLO_g8768 [Triparma laevis f. longispina]|uniref:Uncharacterized protein n=1 Tax=Triparma laevis f. longispina TaxID=1714387 RepID=A0A9W7F488_9STRA|nr:hypothetical protein TrLO_g8768 [Triparma laevis f. longispina]